MKAWTVGMELETEADVLGTADEVTKAILRRLNGAGMNVVSLTALAEGHDYHCDLCASKCRNGCGCWAGQGRSDGPDGLDPDGKCPNSPAAKARADV